MKAYKLFEETKLGATTLLNHIVMAPMTRCRAIDNIPNNLMANYYEQRCQAGLIITEGTSPSPNGLGYARIPGIFSKQQIEGWKIVTNAVHSNGGKIFIQLMHCGRISHPLKKIKERSPSHRLKRCEHLSRNNGSNCICSIMKSIDVIKN